MNARYIERYGVQAALVGLAAIWGGTFVMVADAISRYPMYGFLAWRFGVAAVAFIIFYPKVVVRLDRRNLSWGLLAGVFLSAGYIFQTWGLDGATRTTPARAAFITGLYVILTPLLQALIMRKVPRRSTILGAVIALAGLWLLSGIGAASGGWVLGDSLVAVCALAYSVHMIVLGSTGKGHDVAALTFVQLVTVTVVCTVIAAVKEQPSLPSDPSVIFAIVVTGVFASALAFVIQTWAQGKLPPARVALILVLEPAFGGLIGWAVAGAWPMREVLGASAMLGGMIVSEMVAAMAPAADQGTFEPAVEGMPILLAEPRDPPEGDAASEASGE